MTEKQKKFCEEYLIDLNATQAAIRAGYKPDTAYAIGAENLKKPQVRARIDTAIAEQSRRTGVTADRVVRELARVAFANAEDIVDFDNAMVRADASREDIAAIASVKMKSIPTPDGDGVEREIKLADKLRALELLGKHLGMYQDKLKLSGQVDTGQLDKVLAQLSGDDDG